MYLAGVSVRRMEDVTELLWGSRVSASTVSNLNQKVYGKIEEWRNRPLSGEYPYVYVDGIYLKRSWGGEMTNVSVLVVSATHFCKLPHNCKMFPIRLSIERRKFTPKYLGKHAIFCSRSTCRWYPALGLLGGEIKA